MKMYRLGAIVAIGLLAACGGGDDEAAGVDSDTGSSSDSSGSDADSIESGSGGAGGDDGNRVEITELDGIPEECRQILGDFLRQVEPVVSDLDWQTATMSDLVDLGPAIDGPSADVDVEMERAGCNDIAFAGGEDAGFSLSLELARQEAPGAVGWLEFVRNVTQGFEASEAPIEASGDPANEPEDCDEAMAAVRDLMSASDSMMELQVDDVLVAGTVLQAIPAVCSVEEIAALYDDADFQAWSEG